MKQKLLSFILLLSVGISAAHAYSFSAVAPSGQTLYYTITSSGSPPKVRVTYPGSYNSYNTNNWTGYTKPTGNLTIPATVTNGGTTYSVTSIGNYAFSGCSGLTSVTIPNSVTSIGNGAFYGCSGLTSVTIPNSVTSIGNGAFYGCSGLTSVTIPNSVTSIGDFAFSLVRHIEYHGTALGARWGAISMNGVTDGVFVYSNSNRDTLIAYIGNEVIVSIPNSVTSIGNSAFSDCTVLTSVSIPNSVTSIGNSAFLNVRHIEYHGTATGAPWGAFSMNGVTDGDFVFSNTNRDTLIGYIGNGGTVTIPNSVTSIGNYAFSGCSGLTSVTIPNSVTSIGNMAFSFCRGLTSVSIPNSVTSIGNWAFQYCSNLDSVPIPNTVTTIAQGLFYGCSGLTSVTIPTTITTIQNQAFYRCISLTSVTIPNSVTTIEWGAFQYCTGLTSMTIPSSVTSIGNSAFYNCSRLTSVTIPNSVTSIDSNAFYRIKMIYYYGSATGAPWGALCMNGYVEDSLYYTSSAKDTLTGAHPSIVTANIPNSVTHIGNSAFYQCSNLISVNIPNSVSSIGVSAFSNCSGLTTVNFNADRCTYAGYYDDNNNGSIFNNCTLLSTINFGNSVTMIPAVLCCGCNSLTSVSIPNSVTSIGDGAFYNCSSLTSVTIPNSVTDIGHYTFYGCSGLTSVTIPNSVTDIGHYTFYGCSGLTSVTIPNSVTNIGYYAFSGCSGLTSVTIPNSVTNIGYHAFSGCSGLTSITAKSIVAPSYYSSFSDDPKNIPIYIPCGSSASYRSKWGIYSSDWGYRNYIEVPFFISISSADTTMGSATVVNYPTCSSPIATIAANPIAGCTFTCWTEEDTVVSTDAAYTFTVTADCTLNAHFAPATSCGITATDLPYTDNFDAYTTSTTAKTGVQPDCWTLEHQDVAMADEYKPMIYYSSANAHSGNYSLILNKRGIYAMPEFDGDVNTRNSPSTSSRRRPSINYR